MSDYIIRATAAGGMLRAFAASTRDLVETARQKHNTSPVATAALGRLLTAGAMMGSMMKQETDLLTLTIHCDGPIGGLTVTADAAGNVKGYVNNPMVVVPCKDRGKLDVGLAVGAGTLNVVQDIGMKEPYVGQIALVSGEIAEDLTYYYAVSEQTPSSVALGVLMNRENTVRQAGGFLLQLMPGAQEEVVEALERRIAAMAPVTSLLEDGLTPEGLLGTLLQGMEPEITSRLPARFFCHCDRERVKKALRCIARGELQELIEEGKPVELHCHFCNRSYMFSVEELEELLRKR